MKLLDLLAEAISAEKEKALRDKFVQVVDKDTPKGMVPFEPNKISDKEFKALLDIDQTPNGTYLNWLITRYVKLDRSERKRFFEDGHNEEVKELLLFFDSPKNKSSLKKAITNPKYNLKDFKFDINQYKTLRDFENIIASVRAELLGKEDSDSGSDEKPTNGEPYFVKKLQYPIKIGVTNSGWTAYKISTKCKGNKDCYEEYRQLIGCRGSETANQSRPKLPKFSTNVGPSSGFAINYCTRYPNQFDSYLTNGPYYVFINWNAKRIVQLHYESGQLKDENDDEINGYNSKLQNEILQFLLDKEGRIPPQSMSFNLDLKKYKIGNKNEFDIYKIGPAYYLDAKTGADQQNKLVYFDSETGLLKNANGTQAGAKQALKYPYINLLQYLMENDLVNKDTLSSNAYRHWITIRVLGNINIPETAKPTLQGNINISNTGIKKLPNNLTITGDFNISNNPDLTLPPGLKVGGTLDVRGTKITNVPSGTAAKVIQ